jgi:hypothetical protein
MPPPSLKAYRAQLLRFDEAGQPLYEPDGLLLIERDSSGVWRVKAVGDARTLLPTCPDVEPLHWPKRLIAPGFVDLHVHYPQLDVIGSPADGLLPWLERYTFVSYCQIWCMRSIRQGDHQAAHCCCSCSFSLIGSPSLKTTPSISSAMRSCPRMRRQDFSASCTSLKARPRKVERDTQFFVRVVRWRTVAKVDSIGLVVRKCTQCSAGKS